MQIHEIQPNNKPQKKKRIGRGGKRGTYSGRGIKGQKARAGRKMPPAIRELIKRYPKLRGYKFSALKSVLSVNLDAIEKNFKEGEEVTSAALVDKGVVRREKGKNPLVKVLGRGEIKKAVTVSCATSKSAKEKIEAAGGKVTEK